MQIRHIAIIAHVDHPAGKRLAKMARASNGARGGGGVFGEYIYANS